MAVADGSPPTGITDTTIRIGVEAAVGSLSLDGENLGFKLAFEEANAAGGVHGRRFVWTERRRASGEPADVLAVARQMIDDDHVFALVNFSGPAIGDIVAHARSRARAGAVPAHRAGLVGRRALPLHVVPALRGRSGGDVPLPGRRSAG